MSVACCWGGAWLQWTASPPTIQASASLETWSMDASRYPGTQKVKTAVSAGAALVKVICQTPAIIR